MHLLSYVCYSAATPKSKNKCQSSTAIDSDIQSAKNQSYTPSGNEMPSKILDLKNWYITLPSGKAGSPDVVHQPTLASYVNSKYFYVNPTKDAVVFVAPVDGVTTKNSGYSRSELREMINNGKDKAAWDMGTGTHTMTIVQAVHHLPIVKPHTVCGQIHDAKSDLIEVRLEGTKLVAKKSSINYGTLDSNYKLGTKFTLQFKVEKGRVSVYYNDMTKPKITTPPSQEKGCYFKAGEYIQSSLSKGDKAGAYAETWIYSLNVSHT